MKPSTIFALLQLSLLITAALVIKEPPSTTLEYAGIIANIGYALLAYTMLRKVEK